MNNKKEKKTKTKKNRILNIIQIILIIGIIIFIPIFIKESIKLREGYEEFNNVPTLVDGPATEGMPITDIPPEEWPEGELFVVRERSEYQSKDLKLVVPRMDCDEYMVDGTSQAALRTGPGLYEYSQLPGEGNRNVSIAAHRAGYSHYANLFKQIHTIKEGDLLYLVDSKYIYTYVYKDTKVVTPDDWTVIELQGFSCLTLTSCHPLGDNTHRIIVRSELESITPFDDNFKFVKNIKNRK